MGDIEGTAGLRYYSALRASSYNNKKKRSAARGKKVDTYKLSLRDLFDVDANLTSDILLKDGSADRHAAAARAAGTTRMIVPGSTLKESASAARLASDFAADGNATALFATAGAHPFHATEELSTWGTEAISDQVRRLVDDDNGHIVAVGECGLDYSPSFPPPKEQKAVFEAQVSVACDLGLPLFLHERLAHDDFVRILRGAAGKLPPVLVHCFTGTGRELAEYLSMGFYISLSGIVCKPERGKHIREIIPSIPLDRLMVETDAPYLGFKGCRSRCANRKKLSLQTFLLRCLSSSNALLDV